MIENISECLLYCSIVDTIFFPLLLKLKISGKIMIENISECLLYCSIVDKIFFPLLLKLKISGKIMIENISECLLNESLQRMKCMNDVYTWKKIT